MTLKMYIKELDKLSNTLLDECEEEYWEENYKKLSEFQRQYMEQVVKDYEKKIDCDARQCIYNVLHHAVHWSETGNAVTDIPDGAEDKVENIIQNEIGQYLLDYEIYREDGHMVLDCMFAGAFVPYWDGWSDMA